MRQVHMCMGDYATTPYCFETLGIRVFCIEELCYVLKENAFFLDQGVVDRKLVKWIEDALRLPELAASLYPLIRKRESAAGFVSLIEQYVGLFDKDDIKKMESIYRSGANLNVYQKQKSRVDFLLNSGKYHQALTEYEQMLTAMPDGESELRVQILHNMGVSYSRLFLFDQAAEYFYRAYEMSDDMEEMVACLGAKRMLLSEKEYLNMMSQMPQFYKASLELEKRVELIRNAYEDSEEKKALNELEEAKYSGSISEYYDSMDAKIAVLQNEYRAGLSG